MCGALAALVRLDGGILLGDGIRIRLGGVGGPDKALLLGVHFKKGRVVNKPGVASKHDCLSMVGYGCYRIV